MLNSKGGALRTSVVIVNHEHQTNIHYVVYSPTQFVIDVLVNIQDSLHCNHCKQSCCLQKTDCTFVPILCGMGRRQVIVAIQLLFVEATIVYTRSAIVLNKLGEDSNGNCHAECKRLWSSATKQLVLWLWWLHNRHLTWHCFMFDWFYRLLKVNSLNWHEKDFNRLGTRLSSM